MRVLTKRAGQPFDPCLGRGSRWEDVHHRERGRVLAGERERVALAVCRKQAAARQGVSDQLDNALRFVLVREEAHAQARVAHC